MELDSRQEGEVRTHLDGCAACRGAFAAAEPSFALAAGLRRPVVSRDGDAFVAEVMAGVRQRRSERRLGSLRRSRWPLSLAAAAVLAVAVGLMTLRSPSPSAGRMAAVATAEADVSPALVEIEGEDVRVYQLAANDGGAIQVAFVIDPRMEL